ncbi:MAG: hypothetical protein R3B97_15475 [Dehalococcoidia bacterium]
MLSVQFIRDNTDRVKRDLALRNTSAPIDRIVQLDERRRACSVTSSSFGLERNAVSREDRQRQRCRCPQRGSKQCAWSRTNRRLDADLKAVESSLTRCFSKSNIVDPEAPRGPDEHSNVVLETVGGLPEFAFTPRPHWELGELVDGMGLERREDVWFALLCPSWGHGPASPRSSSSCSTSTAVPDSSNTICRTCSRKPPHGLRSASKFRDNLYRDAEEDYFFVPTTRRYRSSISTGMKSSGRVSYRCG